MRLALTMLLAVSILGACPPKKPPQGPTPAGSTDQPSTAGEGTLTQEQLEEVQSTVRTGLTSLNRCYEQALEASDKKFTAKMVAKILIGTTGAARQVTFAETQGMSPAFQACLVKHIKSWEFPKVASDSWFTYPLVFEPAY